MESPSGADVLAEDAEDETVVRDRAWIGLRQARADFATCCRMIELVFVALVAQ